MMILHLVEAIDGEPPLNVINHLTPGEPGLVGEVSVSLLEVEGLQLLPFIFASVFTPDVGDAFWVEVGEDFLKELVLLDGLVIHGGFQTVYKSYSLQFFSEGFPEFVGSFNKLFHNLLLDGRDMLHVLINLDETELLSIFSLSHFCETFYVQHECKDSKVGHDGVICRP